MILVTGGIAQGKLDYAMSRLGVTDYDDGVVGDTDCIYNLQKAVMNEDFDSRLDEYIMLHPHCVIICDEIGSGIVPLRREDREWREKTGRVCCELANQADAVYRVFCGIGMQLK